MTLDECVSLGLNVLCAGHSETSILKDVESLFVIASCIALMVAAYVGWQQLKLINVQIMDARKMQTNSSHLQETLGGFRPPFIC